MLTVSAFWSNDSFRVEEAHKDMVSIPNRAFRKAYSEGAAMVEKAIENGALSEPGSYVFIEDDKGNLLGYEKVQDI